MQIYQRLKAQNDVNGNPRRLYVVYDLNDGGQIWRVYDEGFHGKPVDLDGLIEIPSVNITASDYRDYLRLETPYRKAGGRD